MTLKKKLAVSSLAVSLAAASVAGLPVGQSLESVLGSGVASALTVSQEAVIKERMAKLHAAITSEDAKAALREFRTEVNNLSESQLKDILLPVRGHLGLDEAQETVLFNLYKELTGLFYDTELTQLREIRNNPEYIALFNEISEIVEIDITVDDVFEAVFGSQGVERQFLAILNTKSASQLAQLATSETLQRELLNQAIDIVTAQTGPGGLALSNVLAELNITKEDVKLTINNARAALEHDQKALEILALAYISAFHTGPIINPPINPGPGPSPGPAPTTPTPTVTEGVVTVPVTVVDGVATANVTLATVTAGLASAAQAGLDTLTLDLGTITAPTVKAPLSKEILDAIKANATVENVAITFNGLSLTIPVAQFNDAIELTVTTAAPSTIASVTTMNVASDVYEFGFTVGGVETTTFRQPLTLTLPLKNAAGLDQELLSVVKIINNTLQAHGGVVEGNTIVEPRDSFSTYTVVENKVTFSDIASVQAWAGRQIQVVAAKGAIEGVGNAQFAPKANVTRAEFAKMLVRALNLENNSATEGFADVQPNDWFAPYVAVAAEKGIITGRSATVFDPGAPISRAEMATMIARAVKLDNPAAATDSSILAKFADAGQISAALRDGVQFAASHNLVIGSDGKFYPNNTATRAEAAVIIYRTINFE